MADYTCMLKSINESPILQNVVREMVERTGAIDLVRNDWATVLQSHPVYKKHSERSVRYSKARTLKGIIELRSILNMDNYFNVVVAGSWYFDSGVKKSLVENEKGPTLLCRLCNPLREIAKVMQENPDQKVCDNARFFFDNCNVLLCCHCRKAFKKLKPEDRNGWCVRKTRLFDGEEIKHSYQREVERLLSGSGGQILAIVNLSISNRYTFGENSIKIGGIIKDVVFFKEVALSQLPYAIELDDCESAGDDSNEAAAEAENVLDTIPTAQSVRETDDGSGLSGGKRATEEDDSVPATKRSRSQTETDDSDARTATKRASDGSRDDDGDEPKRARPS